METWRQGLWAWAPNLEGSGASCEVSEVGARKLHLQALEKLKKSPPLPLKGAAAAGWGCPQGRDKLQGVGFCSGWASIFMKGTCIKHP